MSPRSNASGLCTTVACDIRKAIRYSTMMPKNKYINNLCALARKEKKRAHHKTSEKRVMPCSCGVAHDVSVLVATNACSTVYGRRRNTQLHDDDTVVTLHATVNLASSREKSRRPAQMVLQWHRAVPTALGMSSIFADCTGNGIDLRRLSWKWHRATPIVLGMASSDADHSGSLTES